MYNFDFLFAALSFILLTWMHFRKIPTLKDTNRRIFSAYLIVGVSDIILDIISSYIISLHDPNFNVLGVIVTTLLYIFQAILVFCMLIYGISLRDIPQEKIIQDIRTWAICPIGMVMAVLANLHFGQFFYFDSLGNYIHGPAYMAMYVYAGLMCIYLGVLNVVYRKEINESKRAVIWELLIIVMACVVLQAINSNILLTGFGIGLGLVLLMLTLNNPYSQTDNLTGKLDQNSMILTMNGLLAKGKDFHVIAIRISHLRQINNVFGTKAADDFIVHVIRRIDKLMDASIFRMSGKQFIIVFDELKDFIPAKGKIAALFKNDESMNHSMSIFPIKACSIVSASQIGSVDDILNYIDYLFDHEDDRKDFEMIESVDSTMKGFLYSKEVERFIPEAIEKKFFEPYFQPIYDVQKGMFTSVEVLARLQHPTLGYILPDIFIEMAQKNDMISEIDNLQFESVCQFLDENRELLNQISSVKFNLSPSDILKPGLTRRRLEVMEKYNLSPSLFQFEITETLATVYGENLYHEIETLMNEGIEICMDDFGSGYANLSSVLRLPFSSIKIDRSLLIGVNEDEKKMALYKGLVAGFKDMGLKIISEGIEKEQEYNLLKSWGVDMIQGYYFSRPLNRNDLLKKLLNKA